MGRLASSALRVLLVLGGIALAYAALTFVQVWYASTQDQARPAQAVIVLGAAQYDGIPSPVLRARLDHAADLVQQDLAPVLVVTGGRRTGDRVTEAGASADYLHQRGIPDAALRREVQGRNSWEQLAASARFLRREGINDVLLVSDPYHSYRIGAIADEVGLEAATSPTKANQLSAREQTKALLRETVAVAVGRILGYRRLTGIVRPLETADAETFAPGADTGIHRRVGHDVTVGLRGGALMYERCRTCKTWFYAGLHGQPPTATTCSSCRAARG